MKTKKQKREEATLRAKERASRKPEEQIKRLDKLLGECNGAAKERAQLVKKTPEKLLMCGHYLRQHPDLSATGCLVRDYDGLDEELDKPPYNGPVPDYPLDD